MALPTALLVKGGVAASTVALGGVAIFQRENIYYLIYPNDNRELNKKIKDLGISGCELENEQTKKENCTLSNKQLKDVKFTKDATDLTATGDSISTELTIEKLGDNFKTDFPEGLRFIFKNPHSSEDVTIGSGSNQITLKAGVSYDFKITSDGTKLEKAWDLTTLQGKAGVTCTPAGENTDITECNLTTGKINVWKSNNDYITEATQTDTTKKISVAKETSDHNGGFKFTVSADTTINQTDNSKKVGSVEKLTQTSTNSTSYEIDIKDLGGDKGKKWFLVEKSTAGS